MINEKQVISALGALAQETRLQIVRFLVQQGADGAPAGDIARKVGASASRLSFHLSALEQAGIIGSQRVSRSIVYRVDYNHLGGVISYLLEDCCGNHPDVRACCLGSGC